jgi:hypothetical protein
MASQEGIVNDRIELVLKELQNVLTFGYISLIIIGMIFEATYYYHFGINIFEYSDILDFLLAPFRRPISIYMLLFIIGLSALTYRMDVYTQKRYPKLHRVFNLYLYDIPFMKRNRIWVFIIMAIILLFVYANLIGAEARNELPDLPADIEVVFSDTNVPSLTGRKIGQNQQYIFVLEAEEKVRIIPIDSDVRLLMPIE